jgi:hypothetical protein
MSKAAFLRPIFSNRLSFLYPNQIRKSNRDVFGTLIMTTIHPSTICGYSTETLLALLLGNVTKQKKADILEEAKGSPELSAFINYLHRLLQANDFDVEAVTKIAEQQMAILVEELKKFNEELEKQTPSEITENAPTQHNESLKVWNNSHAPNLEAVGARITTFSIAFSGHTNRLPPTDSLSITGLNETRHSHSINELTTAISSELERHPLDEQGLERVLTVFKAALYDRPQAMSNPAPIPEKRSLWSWPSLKWLQSAKMPFLMA